MDRGLQRLEHVRARPRDLKEDLAPVGLPGWSLIGVLEAGINPYSGMLDNGPRSLADNNARPAGKYPWQTSNFDGSRAGQWDNSQAYVGFSHPAYGSITFGRTNSLSFDAISAYDPVASIAFSALGFSNSFPGFGDTVTARPNTAFTYRLTYGNFRAAAQAQIGGYDWGNGTQGMYQGQLGADFGPLSLDGVVSWAKDAVSLSSFSGSNVACVKSVDCFIYVNNAYYDPNSVLKATLSNDFGLELVAKYKWNAVTFYGGYLYANLSNPSDDYLTGFPTVAEGIFIPPGAWSKGVYTNAAVTDNAYNINRKLNTVWTGFKWSVWSNLTFAMAFYYQSQNDYSTAPCTGTGAFISSSACAGSQDAHLAAYRLSAARARRPLRGRDAQQRLRRPRQRLHGDHHLLRSRRQRKDLYRDGDNGAHAGIRSDIRHPHPVLTERISSRDFPAISGCASRGRTAGRLVLFGRRACGS